MEDEKLRFPPSNRFEALKGERQGQFSVRVNQRWRLCFEYDGQVQNLELVDYH
ncbi:MAG: type II toxin-antitoxin system RelE/ParE family toxin [SAR324 cluster bacterium]|nr:type II toxin-antitoxin system RelE/ParE family toxin [SAR324 cluster bacterium]